ncbi:MAG: carboxypeptidase regulatory-like domain-containing protein [Crocinitomicaceae bacterium]
MKLIYALLISFAFCGASFAQDFSIRGVIYSAVDGEPLEGEKIRLLNASDSSSAGGAYTDQDGLFNIAKVSKGDYILQVTAFGFELKEVAISVTKASGNKDFTFELEKDDKVKNLGPVNVSAEQRRKEREVLIGVNQLDQKGLERIPSTGGENDIVAAFSVTPGVVTTGDQGGQLYVRGGTPIQNKILLDGMTIYQPFHSIGFFSIFETELVQSADIYTGGFDAQYGGRISSIMDITYRDGNNKKFSGKASLSPFMGKLVLEGPLGGKDRSGPGGLSYVFSGKQSLIDQSSQILYPDINRDEVTGESPGMPFQFTDFFGKLTYKGEGRSKVSAFGFHNNDRVNYSDANINWKQSGGGMNFLLVPSGAKVFIKGHLNASRYSTVFDEILTAGDTIRRSSSIGGFDLGFDFTYFIGDKGEINYGLNLGGFNTDFVSFNEAKRQIGIEQFTTEVGAYVNYRLALTRWVINPSIRFQMYASYNEVSPEPRLGLKFIANEKLRLKASGGRYSQNFTSAQSDRDVVNLFNGMLTAPTNVQSTFVTQFQNEKNPSNGLQYAWHAIGGFEYDFTKKLSLNVEAYYKYFSQLSNINQNKIYDDNDIQFAGIDDVFKKDFIIENGESYGADFLLKYSAERLFLWGVYSYGNSMRWDGFQFYRPVFDRRHNINLVGTYLFGKEKDLEVSIRWNLGSGLPFTPTTGFFEEQNFQDGVTSDYVNNNPSYVAINLGEFNSERLPYYHRMDISIKKRFEFKNSTVMEVNGSVTNVYNRRNIFYVNRVTGREIYQFPILPSLGLSYKW